MGKSERDLQTFHLIQSAQGLVAPAARSLLAATRSGRPRHDAVWALGSFVEVGGWLCLGSDLGYFRREELADALVPFFRLESARAILDQELVDEKRIVGNEWAEHLISGHLDQALEVRLFADMPTESRALQPAFQSAWNLAARLAGSEPPNRFLQALLLMDDDDWQREYVNDGTMFEVIHAGAQQAWKRLAAGHPLDGLVATLHHLQILSTWAASTREAESPWERLSTWERLRTFEPTERTPQTAVNAARLLLVKSVGKLLRWRLDFSNERVRKRLGEAIGKVDELMSGLMRSVGYDIKDAWPEGFQVAMQQALDDWDEITGEPTRKARPPKGGGPSPRASSRGARLLAR